MREHGDAALAGNFIRRALRPAGSRNLIQNIGLHAEPQHVDHLAGQVEIEFHAREHQHAFVQMGFARNLPVIRYGEHIVSLLAIQGDHFLGRPPAIRICGVQMKIGFIKGLGGIQKNHMCFLLVLWQIQAARFARQMQAPYRFPLYHIFSKWQSAAGNFFGCARQKTVLY